MVQINCRNERDLILQSIDIDFCLLIQLINSSNHIEYKKANTKHEKKTLIFVELHHASNLVEKIISHNE